MALDLTDKGPNGYDFTATAGTVAEETSDKPTVAGNVACANFDTSSTITCGTDFTQIDGSDFTIETWLKQKGTAGDRTLVNKGGYAGLNIYIQDPDTLVAQWNSTTHTSTLTLTDTTWIHLAFVADISAGTCRVLKNGVFWETLTGLSTSGIPNNASGLYIGSPAANGFYIDEYRVWNDIRTDQEISDNKSVRLVGNEANLVLYLPFESLDTGNTIMLGANF